MKTEPFFSLFLTFTLSYNFWHITSYIWNLRTYPKIGRQIWTFTYYDFKAFNFWFSKFPFLFRDQFYWTLADRWKFWLLTAYLLSSVVFVYILQLHKTFFRFSVWDFGKRCIKLALKLDWKNPSLHQSSEVYFLWLHLADRCNQCSKSPIKNKIRDKVWFTIMKPHLALPGTAHCKVLWIFSPVL